MLLVYLHKLHVGSITLDQHGDCEFAFTEDYIDMAERPVLSQSFVDHLHEMFVGRRSQVPAFFRNLLPDPEGRHRDFVAKELGIKAHQEYAMLALLGGNLPGAVSVVWDGDRKDLGRRKEDFEADFKAVSIAGTQPKFSTIVTGSPLRWLVQGQKDSITKPPDAHYLRIPENEFSMMRWARASGIDCADVELVPMTQLKDLPEWLQVRTGNALVVRRFDRNDEQRIHIEDLAQAWGLHPDEKYEKRHLLPCANLLLNLRDTRGFEEFIRRIVFFAACGNSDGHLKNFSLIYHDPLKATLAPAYDIVSTIQYPNLDNDGLALRLGSVKKWDELSSDAFARFATKLNQSPAAVINIVRETALRAKDCLGAIRKDLPLTDGEVAVLEAHWKTVPILS